MPAVQLARLKTQVYEISWLFTRPDEFCAAVNRLLQTYADVLFREGKAVKPVSLLEMYHVPSLVLRQMRLQIGQLCLENPQAALGVVDALLADPHLEVKLLGAGLLGFIPLEPPLNLENRLSDGLTRYQDPSVREALLDEGTARLRRDRPARMLDLAAAFLNRERSQEKATGLQLLARLAREDHFENLPAVFNMISPLFGRFSADLQSDLLALLLVLARKSQNELVFFLRQMLSLHPSPALKRFTRRSLASFPPAVQSALRLILQQI